MSKYPSVLVTNLGLDMIGECEAEGKSLIFTNIKLGDGQITTQPISELTDLLSPKMTVALTGGTHTGSQVELRFYVTNDTLENGFFAREIGIFAKVGDSGTEKLYGYTNGGNYVDYIPDKTSPIEAQIVNVHITTGNASSVVIEVSSKVFVTKAEAEAMFDEHNKDYEAHYGILNILQRKKAYVVNDIAKHKDLSSWLYLQCITAGTTGASEPTLTGKAEGDEITDGTAKWKVVSQKPIWTKDTNGNLMPNI